VGDWKSLKEELSVPVWKGTAGDSQTQKNINNSSEQEEYKE